MKKDYKPEIVLLISLLVFVALSIIFQWNLIVGIDFDALYILKEKLLILGLGYFAYKNVDNSILVFSISSVMLYAAIQLVVYILTIVNVLKFAGIILLISNPAISLPLCAFGGIILAGIAYLTKK